ncbi:hypothetical protein [Candidatus Phyllobacterium onerii]|uniref:hypothetical protein n=1 Tax=Candidatus Phyllobacterium onerii TaxID=3020828 RepID=UPI00232D66FE|nr:hypothetical protein [Phyllobacterium sp. IY22]
MKSQSANEKNGSLMMFNPNAEVRIFIPDEILNTTVKTFTNAKDALAAMSEHSVLKVEVEGYGPMIPDEFVAGCAELGLSK